MDYGLVIGTGGFEHPPFPYATLEAALAEVEQSLKSGLYSKGGPLGRIAIQLGTGALIRLMSSEAVKKKRDHDRSIANNPLLSVKDSAAPWQMVVQIGTSQIPPLDMASEEAAEEAVATAISTGVFRHILEPEHDYLWIQTGPGIVYMCLPTAQYIKQRRAAIEAQMRAYSQARQQAAKPLILDPSGRPRG
jgi:hypothetical protein